MIGLAAVCACSSTDVGAPSATVIFVLDAPLCSSIIPVQFTIDSLQVGTDTFKVDVAGGPHTTSHSFAVAPGHHTLSARIDRGFVWPDKSVTLAAGQAFADTLPTYCS